MIVDFSVENFRSLKELQTLSMAAAPIASKYKDLDTNNLFNLPFKTALLKTKAVYGANASGKSNLVVALNTFISIVTNSVKDEKSLAQIGPFRLSTTTEDKPSFFQLSFLLNGVLYRYGFEATRKEIVSEWLFGTPGKKEVPFFTREGSQIKINNNQFREGQRVTELYTKQETDIARKNSLFLTTASLFSNGIAKQVVDYIGDIIVVTGLQDYRMHKNAEDVLSDDEQRRKMVEFLKIADIGIVDIQRVEYQNTGGTDNEKMYLTVTGHQKYDADLKDAGTVNLFMLTEESEGSKKMFEISPLIAKALHENQVLVMDEFDARFHPLLTRRIVELFHSEANKGSQFVFVTHDTNLLNARLLRRDQVSFVEKDRYGASHFYSLVDFKGVRNDASFEKDYISGKYGAIPFLGDFSAIIEN